MASAFQRRILVTVPSDPVTPALLLRGVLDAAATSRSWAVEPISMHHADAADRMRSPAVAGVLLAAANTAMLAAARDLAKPVVLTHNSDPLQSFPCVCPDEHGIGRLAARHLLHRGWRNLAFLGIDQPWSLGREQGFIAEASRAGCQVHRALDRGGERISWQKATRPSFLKRWLQGLPTPIGMLACCDQLGLLVQNCCAALKLEIPDTVAVVGVDNSLTACTMAPVPMSSIDPDPYSLGYAAARLLLEWLQGRAPARRPVHVQPRAIEIRLSSDRYAYTVPEVNQAMRYIHQNASEGIDVEDVVDAVCVSRATLHRIFRQYVGRTPGQEIRHAQMQRAVAMLVHSNEDIVDIAIRCGFSSHSYFTQAFAREYATSPSDYRRRRRANRAVAESGRWHGQRRGETLGEDPL